MHSWRQKAAAWQHVHMHARACTCIRHKCLFAALACVHVHSCLRTARSTPLHLVRAHVQPPVDLYGVCADDLAAELLCQGKGYPGLAHCCGASQDYDLHHLTGSAIQAQVQRIKRTEACLSGVFAGPERRLAGRGRQPGDPPEQRGCCCLTEPYCTDSSALHRQLHSAFAALQQAPAPQLSLPGRSQSENCDRCVGSRRAGGISDHALFFVKEPDSEEQTRMALAGQRASFPAAQTLLCQRACRQRHSSRPPAAARLLCRPHTHSLHSPRATGASTCVCCTALVPAQTHPCRLCQGHRRLWVVRGYLRRVPSHPRPGSWAAKLHHSHTACRDCARCCRCLANRAGHLTGERVGLPQPNLRLSSSTQHTHRPRAPLLSAWAVRCWE